MLCFRLVQTAGGDKVMGEVTQFAESAEGKSLEADVEKDLCTFINKAGPCLSNCTQLD